MDIDYETTTYTDSDKTHTAIMVDWTDIEELLGRKHSGTPADDERIVAALLASGAPDWVRGAEGWVDEDGWGLIGPVMWCCDNDSYGVTSYFETVEEFLAMCSECFDEDYDGVPTLVAGFDREGNDVYRDELTREIVLSRPR